MKFLVAVILVATLIVLWLIIMFYADATVILAPSPRGMQKLLDICSEYAAKYELKYNPQKTKCVIIKPKWIRDIRVPQFVLAGSTLTFTDVTKYLGSFISNKVTYDCDINRQVICVYSRGNI